MNRQLRGNLPPNEKANGKNRFLSLLLLFMAFISVQVYAQDVKVSGTVIAEADKFPIIGANIVVKGTTIGTVTDKMVISPLTFPRTRQSLSLTSVVKRKKSRLQEQKH